MPTRSVERHAAFITEEPDGIEPGFCKGISLPVSCKKKLCVFGIMIAEEQESSGPDYRPYACKKLRKSPFVPNLVRRLHRNESVDLPKDLCPSRFAEIGDYESDTFALIS